MEAIGLEEEASLESSQLSQVSRLVSALTDQLRRVGEHRKGGQPSPHHHRYHHHREERSLSRRARLKKRASAFGQVAHETLEQEQRQRGAGSSAKGQERTGPCLSPGPANLAHIAKPRQPSTAMQQHPHIRRQDLMLEREEIAVDMSPYPTPTGSPRGADPVEMPPQAREGEVYYDPSPGPAALRLPCKDDGTPMWQGAHKRKRGSLRIVHVRVVRDSESSDTVTKGQTSTTIKTSSKTTLDETIVISSSDSESDSQEPEEEEEEEEEAPITPSQEHHMERSHPVPCRPVKPAAVVETIDLATSCGSPDSPPAQPSLTELGQMELTRERAHNRALWARQRELNRRNREVELANSHVMTDNRNMLATNKLAQAVRASGVVFVELDDD
jgi:hypothetical protein